MLTRLFPTPSFLSLPATGVDFSDTTMRFMKLSETIHGILPAHFGEATIPEGCMKGGRIVDEARFTAFLIEMKKLHKLKYVRVAIPESQTYSFMLTLDALAAANIRGAIELVLEDNIPLKAVETVFDYHVLSETETNIVVQVVALSESAANSFCNCFMNAGLVPVSFELDSQATARAIIKPNDKASYMIVDFGANRTGITVVTNGTAVFTTTIEFGGNMLLDILQKDLGVSLEEAQRIKLEWGLAATGEHKNIFQLLVGGVATLKDEINRRYLYWQEKREQHGGFPPVTRIYLSGGHSNLRGLADYLSVGLKLEVVQANPWVNCVSFDVAIPSISAEASMSYVTGIGLALADYIHD
jgi:type IV pilus assembly protein PilM